MDDLINILNKKIISPGEGEIPTVLKEGGLQFLSENYIPKNILYREEHIIKLGKMIKECLEFKTPATILLEGSPGTGKTMCFRIAEKVLQNGISSGLLRGKICYVSGKGSTVFKVANEILKSMGMREERSFGKAVSALKEAASSMPIHVCIDDADLIKSYQAGKYESYALPDLLYYFSRTPGLSATIITNDFRFLEKINEEDARVYSSMTKEKSLIFERYGKKQCYDILRQRVELAFKDGVFKEEALDKLAEYVSFVRDGDIRVGLEILRTCPYVAAQDKEEKIDENIIDKTIKHLEMDYLLRKIYSLPESQRGILAALYLKFREKGEEAFYSNELYDTYCNLLSSLKLPVISLQSFRVKLNELTISGILESIRSSRGKGKGIERKYRPTIPMYVLSTAVLRDPLFGSEVRRNIDRIVSDKISRARGFQ